MQINTVILIFGALTLGAAIFVEDQERRARGAQMQQLSEAISCIQRKLTKLNTTKKADNQKTPQTLRDAEGNLYAIEDLHNVTEKTFLAHLTQVSKEDVRSLTQ